VAVALSVVLPVGRASAWIYPEHRQIAQAAVEGLDAQHREQLDRLWTEARVGHEGRLCASPASGDQGTKPVCIDWTAWSAIGGDHACSGRALVETVLRSRWILEVAAVGARLQERLAKATDQSRRSNELRDSDLRLQRADDDYATRAGSNNAHFLLSLPAPGTDGSKYIERCVQGGAEPNALGIYLWYHRAALAQAAHLATAKGPDRGARALAALADEAFALHFLEDSFAAGHVAGTWGKAAVRKGTHDYYSERGLLRLTWGGEPTVLTGDAHLRLEDVERASAAVRVSLVQVLDAAAGEALPPPAADAAPEASPLDVCVLTAMPGSEGGLDLRLVAEVLEGVPVPSLDEGLGALPRFRAELGPFIGVSAVASGGWISGGFEATQTQSGATGSLEVSIRLGYGLEGVMNQSGDGLVFLDLGLRQDTATSMSFTDQAALREAGAITAAIPARTAYTIRLRMPFWLVPGDLLLAAPVAAISWKTYKHMAVVASNGGLIPWQSAIATRFGRLQFMLGREVGVALYGRGKESDRLLMPPASSGGGVRLVGLRTVALDFPVVEFSPLRSFSMDQSSILLLQLYAGLDIPGSPSPIGTAVAVPELKTIFLAGVRVTFDWRHY
jgi:hypothetical protein